MKLKDKIILPYTVIPLFLYSLLLVQSCTPTEPPSSGNINLQAEDVSCTEAWLRLETQNISLPINITLLNNNSVGQTISLSTPDTILYVDSLLPNKTYTFQAFTQSMIQQLNQSSNKVTVTTLDTTSHNFTWQKFTFGGEAGSSVLYDAAIVETEDGTEEIWAVGEIYLLDSTGQPDPEVYNAVHWDGNRWELKRISVRYRENLITPPLYGIYAFSSKDIWLSSGVPIHGDGTSWTQYHLFDMGILTQDDGYLTEIWGSSSDNLYYIGTKGTIAYYQNGQWSKIDSGTDLDINDIWGAYHAEKDKYEILAAASKRFVNFEKKIIKVTESGVESVTTKGIPYSIHGFWFMDNIFYAVGGGMYRKHDINSSLNWRTLGITNYYLQSIRGNDLNDIVVCGDFGELLHFNGINWKSYQNKTSGVLLLDISIKDDIVVSVGTDNPRAFIIVGKR